MCRKIRRLLVAAMGITTMCVGQSAYADWPVARHDAARSGVSSTTSNITNPIAYWKAYLGGTIASDGLIAADLTNTGQVDILFLSGGVLLAKTPSGTSLWQSNINGIVNLFDVLDIDGDGANDVIAATSDHVYILAAKTGAVEWAEPDGEMGTVGGVRIADLNGDGAADLLIQECGCCSVNSGNPGFVYSFAQGFGSPNRLWALPTAGCGTTGTTVFDGLGNGQTEIVLPTPAATTVNVVSGDTGAVLATSPTVGSRVDFSACTPANVDAITGDELICVQNINLGAGAGGRQVFALKYVTQPTAALDLLWQQSVGDYDGGNLAVKPSFVVDLDGTGQLEVVVAGQTAAGDWTTFVFDAKTGIQVASLSGQQVAGSAALDGNGITLLTYDSSGTVLSGWGLSSGPSHAFTQRWHVSSQGTLTYPDHVAARVSSLSDALMATDLNGDGIADLITQQQPQPLSVTAYSLASGSPVALGMLAAPVSGANFVDGWLLPPTTETFRQPAFVTSDGFLSILNGNLGVDNTVAGAPGLRVGGYYTGGPGIIGNGPVLGKLDSSGKDALLVVDSRGSLVRLDGSAASLVSPPSTLWQRAGSTSPAIVSSLSAGQPGIYCTSQVGTSIPPQFEVAALQSSGTVTWQTAVEEQLSFDIVPANLDGDGVSDAVLQFLDSSNLVHTRGLSGKTGNVLFNSVPTSINSGLEPFAVADWNGDSVDDVVTVLNSIRAISGMDGIQLIDGNTFLAYFLPTLLDVDGDGTLEATLGGGTYPARTLHHDLVTPVWVGEDDNPKPFGSVAMCPAGYVLVEGSTKNPSRLKVTQVAGTSAGQFTTVVLASGALYANEQAATMASASLGTLGNTSVASNLTGTGHPTAVVGSSDGWLYGVNACAGTLDFALQIGSAVGEPAFGDTDGDGKDEVLVTAADGYLYDIKNTAIAAPGYVWDIDPPAGISNMQVNTITTVNTLYCTWQAVSGATGYQVAYVQAGGQFVTVPNWQSIAAGVTTATVMATVPLVDGSKYMCAVRAVSAAGPSVDAISSGVVVHSAMAGDGGPDGSADGAVDAASDAPFESAPPVDAEAGDARPEGGAEREVGGGGCGCTILGDSSRGSRVPRDVLGAALCAMMMYRGSRRRRKA
jgi:hypothetical protein